MDYLKNYLMMQHQYFIQTKPGSINMQNIRDCLPSISISRKSNCMDKGVMENFFGRLKVEMFYGEKFETIDEFINCLKEYIYYCNNERIIFKLKMSPIQYRTHFLAS